MLLVTLHLSCMTFWHTIAVFSGTTMFQKPKDQVVIRKLVLDVTIIVLWPASSCFAQYYTGKDAAAVASLDSSEQERYIQKLKDLQNKSIDEQAKVWICCVFWSNLLQAFLRAFVEEFQGNFEDVLNMVDEFKVYAKGSADGCVFVLFFRPFVWLCNCSPFV